MQGTRRILVGVDFNEKTAELPVPTLKAIHKALWVARTTGASLTLITVLPESLAKGGSPLEEEARQKLATLLDELLAPFLTEAEQGGIDVSRLLAYGRGWVEIIKQVLRDGTDLVIIGTKEKSMAERMIFGSTAIKLLRNCPCPVWVAKPNDDPESIDTILAADDLTPMGEKVLHTAVSTAQLVQAGLVVVHAVHYPLEGAMVRTHCSQEDIDQYRDSMRADAESRLRERLAMTDYRTLQRGTQIVVQGGPADTVIEQAIAHYEVDLAVMGTIARRGIPGYLIGNTAERLISSLDCSLLALKPDGFESPIQLTD